MHTPLPQAAEALERLQRLPIGDHTILEASQLFLDILSSDAYLVAAAVESHQIIFPHVAPEPDNQRISQRAYTAMAVSAILRDAPQLARDYLRNIIFFDRHNRLALKLWDMVQDNDIDAAAIEYCRELVDRHSALLEDARSN